MTVEELIEEAKNKIKSGKGYLDIAEYLKERGADDEIKKRIFEELDKKN
ncbi:MAG TPA: hypothetical protein PLJ60_08550 [Chryseolinea sp.]|nr:hypothetical protein [Chryseolinea sp.]HPH47596.1 hypothetical protein [Chryseolinea sp.]HPM30375.1 hypothetical protein [Chryseolinea sp.]